MTTSFTPPVHTKKRRAGHVIAIVLLALVIVIVTSFAAMFSYFLWVEKYGDADTKAKYLNTFASNFTSAPGASGNSRSHIDVDVNQYIYPHSPQFGDPDASVTMIVFIDFECPFCRQAYPSFEQVRETYGPAVNIVFKHFPIEQFHPRAGNAARAAQCAHQQGAFWPYYQALFDTQRLDDAALLAHANTIGINTTLFSGCMVDSQTDAQIAQDLQDGINLGVRGTPTYIINNQKLEGVTPTEQWNDIIIEALNQ